MKRIYWLARRADFWPLLFVTFFAYLASRYLFGEGYFNMHDDLQMMRQLSMEKCFLDLQIPCRWIPDMGYGFGYPLFNFYPPLPYLFGQVIRLLGYSFVDTAKALFIVSFFASGYTMYYLAKEFFGRLGGAISAVFYIWAPYHAVDVYVRGAMNESWGLIWFPLILWSSYKLIKGDSFIVLLSKKASLKEKILTWVKSNEMRWIIVLALSWFALFTSHNLMVVVFTPFFAIWCLIWIIYLKKYSKIVPLIISGAWSFALASFFTLPVFLEKSIVQTDTLVRGYYEYTAHFPSIRQLFFSRFWGYGPSVWLEEDRMSFQIGWLHWAIPMVVFVFLGFRILRKRKFDTFFWALLGLGFTAGMASFMSHPRSTPIWAHISALQFIQFPWRYLTMVILGTSFIVGAVTRFFPRILNFIIVPILAISVVVYGWSYFAPENGKLGKLTDEEKFTAAAWELQQTAGIYDYLPNTAKTAPKGPRKVQAEVMTGKGSIVEGKHGTNWEEFTIKAEEPVSVRISLLAFPNWVVKVNGEVVDTYVPETEEWGRLYIDVPAGTHSVTAKLMDTPVRTIGNIISLVAWVKLIALFIFRLRTSKSV